MREGNQHVGAMSLAISYRAGDTTGREEVVEAALPAGRKRGGELVVSKER